MMSETKESISPAVGAGAVLASAQRGGARHRGGLQRLFDDRMAEGKTEAEVCGSSVRPQRWRGRFCVSPGGGRSRWAC